MLKWRWLPLVVAALGLARSGGADESTEARADDLRFEAEFAPGSVNVPGAKLSFIRRRGAGPTVLLIPGSFADGRTLAPVARKLSRELDVMILEMRGHGGSTPPPDACSIESLASDVLVAADALGLRDFHVGGHSLGGMIALEIGKRVPDRVRSVLSIEGWTSALAARASFGDKIGTTMSPRLQALIADHRKEVLRDWTAEQQKNFGGAWRRWDGAEFLSTTPLPVLEIYGDRGRPRPDRSKLGLPYRPNVALRWIAGASHWLLLERPAEVAAAINEFVAKIESARRQSGRRCNGHEVVIVGGTPGGIGAALAAARAGSRALLIEHHGRVGGMMTSGLGKSDIENRDAIAGIFREFTSRVLKHYQTTYGEGHENVRLCRNGYYYEPSVAERVLESMLSEQPNVEVWKQWRLASAEVSGNRAAAIELVSRETGERRRVAAPVFIDATYEGDLLAACGAEFRLGREARDEFNEPHAGVIYFDYQNRRILPGSTGEGDDRLPAYTYRLCLSIDPKNSRPLASPPPGYDRNLYAGYFDDLASGRMAAPKELKPGRGYNPAHFDTMVRAFSVTPLPNGKTDVNVNPRPLAFPFAEENRGYIAADDGGRERIAGRHRQLTLGLLWFLQNDPEIPEAHRALAKALQLPADEFADNGHFPFQLYIREGRRLKGLYTLTENDVTATGGRSGRHDDAIAVGEFPLDSFPCRKRQPGDTIVLEGYLGMLDHIVKPYEIPYRIMIPVRVDGLIVPVAASTTHVAFSSIRVEPTWMALGQAAGVAANLAVRRGVAPRNVPIDALQTALRQSGQVIRIEDLPSR